MVKLVYSAVEENGENDDVGKYVTYGICGKLVEIDTGKCIESEMVHDVSTKRRLVEKWAALFEMHQLSLIHFREAVEDRIVMEA